MTERRRRILSIDGGGVRGIIPAVWLAKLEEITGRPTRDHFDFLAGTSTGAVLAAGLAVGIPAKDLVRFYEDDAPVVFRKIWLVSQVVRFFTGNLYSVATLNRLLREKLKDEPDLTLNTLPNDILVTAKRLSDGQPYYFVKDRPDEPAGKTGRLRLADCVTASAAAPTYFEPWEVAGLSPEKAKREMVDGGTGVAGNPVYQACVEAFEFNAARYNQHNSIVVSLGTGRFLERTRPRWLPAWLFWIMSELLRSPGEQQTELVQRHYQHARFYRMDIALERDIALDSIKDLGELRRIAEKHVPELDWPAILAGEDSVLLVGPRRVRPKDYTRPA